MPFRVGEYARPRRPLVVALDVAPDAEAERVARRIARSEAARAESGTPPSSLTNRPAVATSQMPFQESSSLPSLLIAKSRFTPSGFTANSKPLRLSSYESISSLIWSDGPRTSRRDSACMMLSGCGSNMRTKTYRFFSSYATWNSVWNDGAASTCGWNWMNSDVSGVPLARRRHQSRPSIAVPDERGQQWLSPRSWGRIARMTNPASARDHVDRADGQQWEQH